MVKEKRVTFLLKKEGLKLEKADYFILAFAAVALGFLVWLVYFAGGILPSQDTSVVEFLPFFNACMNLLASTFIILGIRAIKRKNLGEVFIERHKRWMRLAFSASSLFLISYLVYHGLHGDTKFIGQGWIRPVYFFILIGHIVLSAVAFPLVLLSFYWGTVGRLTHHKTLARWTYPLWLYVSVTGVLIFILLKIYQ